jgi:cytochrome P450/ferredoxin-NADP reductase
MGQEQTALQDWDPLDADVETNPIDEHARLRTDYPAAYTERFGGFWALTRYADVVATAKDTDTFASRFKTTIPDSTGPERAPRPPLETDPPVHGHYRALLNPYFSPARIRAIEPAIRRIAKELIGTAVGAGTAECVQAISFPMPARVLCAFLGIPADDAARIKDMANEVLEAGTQGDRKRHKEANDRIYAYIGELVGRRRRQPLDPETDVTTGLIEAQIDGAPLNDAQVGDVLRLLLQAGHGTTSNGLGSIIAYLAGNPEDQRRLRAEPALIPAAIEEILRMWSPTRLMARTATRDVTLYDRTISTGDKVALMFSAANRDPEVFDDADNCIIDRKPNRHVAFGAGIHTCLGAALARAELRIALEVLFATTDWFELAGEVTFAGWPHIGPSHFEIKFTPASAARPTKPELLPDGVLELEVAATRRLTERTVELDLRTSDGAELPPWQPGAHIELRLANGLVRQFSLCGNREQSKQWSIAVQRDEPGRGGSAYIHDMLPAGSRVTVAGPRNHFPIQPATRYVFIASGIGITPLMPMARHARSQGVPFDFHYIGKDISTMAYSADLAREFPELQLHQTRRTGRPSLLALVDELPAGTAVYSCGPNGFLTELEQACSDRSVDLHVEWFAPRPGSGTAGEGALESFRVVLAASAKEVDVLPGQSIIDACADAGVTIPGSCFEGTCGSCETEVRSGVPDHRDSVLTQQQRDACRVMMPCVSRSCTPVLTLEA